MKAKNDDKNGKNLKITILDYLVMFLNIFLSEFKTLILCKIVNNF